jgi:hypothetical protein
MLSVKDANHYRVSYPVVFRTDGLPVLAACLGNTTPGYLSAAR